MAVRRNTRGTSNSTRSRREAAANSAVVSTATARAVKKKDVTEYAEKPATPYHKAFASWIVKEVGLDLTGLSAKAAFLKGVSIATAARPSFNESDFLEEWREKTGEVKRGPKPRAAAEEAPPPRRRKAALEPEPEDDDDFEEDDDIDDEDSEDDDFEEDDDDSDDDDDDDFEDEEPAPKQRPAKAATNSRARKAAPARKATPAKAARSGSRTSKGAADDDDDFLF